MAARLKERYQKDVAPQIAKEFGISNPMAVPRIEKIVINMGMGEAIANAENTRHGCRRAARDHRAEAGDHEGEEVDRVVQVATGNADRRGGHVAWRSDVRVSRSVWCQWRCRA